MDEKKTKAEIAVILMIIKSRDRGKGVSYKTLEMFSMNFGMSFDFITKIISYLIRRGDIFEVNDTPFFSLTKQGEIFFDTLDLVSTTEPRLTERSKATLTFLISLCSKN